MTSRLLAVVACLAAAIPAAAQNWPSFRGPDAGGVAAAASTPPASWDITSSRNIAWKVAIPGLSHSSPIVWGDRIYIATAVPLERGTPTIITGESDKAGIDSAKDMVAHTWRLIAFDRATGRVVWDKAVHQGVPRLKRHVKASHASATPATNGRSTQVKVPTPIAAGDLVIVTGGYPPGGRPIYAIRLGGSGDLGRNALAWRTDRGAPYTGTPLLYDGILYACTDNGILSAYDPATGQRIYQQRVGPGATGFSASPIAAAGRLYLASEDGDIFVIKAGRTFELLATNRMGEALMATPAISGNMLIGRTQTELVAIGS